jgi:hypothetical protein
VHALELADPLVVDVQRGGADALVRHWGVADRLQLLLDELDAEHAPADWHVGVGGEHLLVLAQEVVDVLELAVLDV